MRPSGNGDGIRVQLVATRGGKRMYSRGAEDISAAFPEILDAMHFHGVLDGELLVIRDKRVAPFADLQQRLNRKSASAAMLKNFPAAIHLYDMSVRTKRTDLRAQNFAARRAHLETLGSIACGRSAWIFRAVDSIFVDR